jgi:hypothetical protein
LNEDGITGLVPVTVMGNMVPGQPGMQTLVILKVPVAGGGGVDLTVVLPSEQVSATAQDASACLCLANAVLSMVLSLDASETELELLLSVFVFGLTLVFVIL